MAIWQCPHCGAPQPEASRCWVCRKSSTTCSTCRNFRRAVAGQVGFCGLDRRRAPLHGDEIRGCWEVGAEHVEEPAAASTDDDPVRPVHRLRDFVPIDDLRPRENEASRIAGAGSRAARPAPEPAPPLAALEGGDAWRDRVSLFGEDA